jgi:tetratricopeptide (TPR) repeat protein
MSHSPELDHLAARWAEAPDGTAFAALADGLRKAGALAEAEAVALVGLARHPELVPGLLALARVREAQGDHSGASATLQRALGEDPTHPVVLEALAELAAASDDPEGARAWLMVAEAAEGSAPAAIEPPAVVPELPTESAAEAAALTAFESEVELDDGWNEGGDWADDGPVEAEAEPAELVTESLANLYFHQGHLDRAAAAFRTLADRHPDHPEYAGRADTIERDLHARRPRPFDATMSGGTPLGAWLARVAAAAPEVASRDEGFDAFYEAPLPAARDTADFTSFQDWLKGLGR